MLIAYHIFAAIILLVQLPILIEAYRHFHYTRKKYRPKPSSYQPKAALVCPCKGIDTTFDRNIQSLFHFQYQQKSQIPVPSTQLLQLLEYLHTHEHIFHREYILMDLGQWKGWKYPDDIHFSALHSVSVSRLTLPPVFATRNYRS